MGDYIANPVQLKVGDRFFENDTYPEIWEVTEELSDCAGSGIPGVKAKVVGYLNPKWDTGRMGEEYEWFSAVDHLMSLYRIE